MNLRVKLVLLPVLLLVSCAWLPSQAGKTDSGLHNFGEIDNGKICRSAQPEAPRGYETFKQQGGKTVINLRNDWDEQQVVKDVGLNPLWFHLDAGDPPPLEKIEQIVRTMADPANQPVLVHCRFGQDRTGLLIASYRIIENHWTYERAYEELKSYAFAGVEVHRRIVKRLKEIAAKYSHTG